MTDYLDQIQARADAATDGPWTHHEYGNYGDHEPTSIVVMQGDDPGWWTRAREGEYVARLWWDSQAGADAVFIAHARTDVPRLVAALRAVEALCDDMDRHTGEAIAYDGMDRIARLPVDAIRAAIRDALEAR